METDRRRLWLAEEALREYKDHGVPIGTLVVNDEYVLNVRGSEVLVTVDEVWVSDDEDIARVTTGVHYFSRRDDAVTRLCAALASA